MLVDKPTRCLRFSVLNYGNLCSQSIVVVIFSYIGFFKIVSAVSAVYKYLTKLNSYENVNG